ncbi:helix-turn-helix transcriptional regulator [Sphingomonas sp. PAMC 26621]|uniref:helix-turn-helix transcriptional regulator n=1 Tax=Sphingomonas sp. PAMC 26621 TaxID=1112213 RepID=UPI000289125D|nr:helix-turn-helix transcriptional regulator [Sphingomonas sp. PAMC 26621]
MDGGGIVERFYEGTEGWGGGRGQRVRAADPIEALYRAARDPLEWPKALAQLAAHTGAAWAMMATIDFSRDVDSVVTSMAETHPASTAAVAGEIRHIGKQISWRHSAAWTDGGASTGIPPVLHVPPRGSGEGEQAHLVLPHPTLCGTARAGWVSVALRSRQPRYHAQVMRSLSSLREHVIRSFDISLELAGAQDAGLSRATLLSALPTAALLLATDGLVAHANIPARALLRDSDGVLETPDRRLRASVADEDHRLASAIQAALAASRGEPTPGDRQVVRIRRAAATPLLLILDPVPRHHRSRLMDVTCDAVLVRMIDEAQVQDDRTYPLKAAFDLTAAEVRIAAAIASGRSPARAARDLDLSTNTVRSHLARVFDKTGMRSQHALARLLAAIGSWPLQ